MWTACDLTGRGGVAGEKVPPPEISKGYYPLYPFFPESSITVFYFFSTIFLFTLLFSLSSGAFTNLSPIVRILDGNSKVVR